MDLLELIHKDMTIGFDGVHRRLDMLNGQVRKHGEEIAVLKSQHQEIVVDLETLDRHIEEHQVLCPALQDAKEARMRDLKRTSVIAGTASVITAIVLEWGPHIYTFLKWAFS
jgi:hypothetical protein